MTNTILSLHDPQAAKRYYDENIWRSDTFYSLLAFHAQRRPNAWALRDGARRITWGQALRWIDSLAADLHARGVRPGQRVSLWLPSCIESVIALLACARNGYVCNPSLHQNYTIREIAALLTRLDTAALIMQPGYGANAPVDAALADEIACIESLKAIYSLDKPTSDHPTDEPRAGFPPLTDAHQPARDHADRIMYLAFTSGTTGEPKGVLHSANTLLTNTRAMVDDWQHDASTVLLSLSPMSHHIGVVAIGQALVAGCELVVNDPNTVSSTAMLDWIIQSQATYCMGVPTHAIDVLEQRKAVGLDKLGAVKTFYMAGSAIPADVARQFLAIGVMPQNIYGMTENSSHQYTLPDDGVETIVGTCGRACRGFEVAIFDVEQRDRRLPDGEVGEIGSRGGCLMLGYFDNQRATEQSFNRDGWFLSGDLGRVDSNGCLEIVGRIKELIIRGGYNIHPAHIEALAMRHQHIDKAAVVAVPDDRLGEKACLVVTAQESEVPGADAMLSFLHSEGLSKYDMPEYFSVLDAMPLTASGKILKRKLIDKINNGELKPASVRWVEGSETVRDSV